MMAAPGVSREGQPPPRLHNMSAPPQMHISIRPLRVTGADRVRADPRPSTGLHRVAHLDVDALLRAFCRSPVDTPKRRLATLARVSQAALGGEVNALSTLARRSVETLCDTLRENAARLDPRALGLPAFAVVRRGPWPRHPGPYREQDPAFAIALLTRTAGTVFVAHRSPVVVELGDAEGVYELYAANQEPPP